ncbi:MAG: paraquat-inducible membrane protein A, partial [Kingella sp. (in: b-proteobacteria)]
MSSLRQYLYRRINHQWKKIYFPAATLPAHSLDCPECGLHIEVGKIRQGQEAICPRCEHTLFHIEP